MASVVRVSGAPAGLWAMGEESAVLELRVLSDWVFRQKQEDETKEEERKGFSEHKERKENKEDEEIGRASCRERV